ncbi:MAG: hypothetical protein K0S30_1877 [Clostridia bacterium]|nr:hypothetical protein [Clostridia bacterium]
MMLDLYEYSLYMIGSLAGIAIMLIMVYERREGN